MDNIPEHIRNRFSCEHWQEVLSNGPPYVMMSLTARDGSQKCLKCLRNDIVNNPRPAYVPPERVKMPHRNLDPFGEQPHLRVNIRMGDLQPPNEKRDYIIPKSPKPGDIMKFAINQITGVTPCGSCLNRAKQMNEWGWFGCWKNKATIVEWVSEEASKRGHVITSDKILSILRAGFKEFTADKRLKKKTQGQS